MRSNSLADDFALNNHTPNARDREAGFSAQHLRDLVASAARHNCKMRMGNTIRRAAAARVPIPARGKRCCDPERVARASNRGGRFSAKAALTSRTLSPCGFSRWRRSGAASSNLLRAISLSVRFMPRRESAHSTRALAAVHESESGTFEPCRRTITVSVYRGRAEVVGTRPNRRR